jgi:hypothetical protein
MDKKAVKAKGDKSGDRKPRSVSKSADAKKAGKKEQKSASKA